MLSNAQAETLALSLLRAGANAKQHASRLRASPLPIKRIQVQLCRSRASFSNIDAPVLGEAAYKRLDEHGNRCGALGLYTPAAQQSGRARQRSWQR